MDKVPYLHRPGFKGGFILSRGEWPFQHTKWGFGGEADVLDAGASLSVQQDVEHVVDMKLSWAVSQKSPWICIQKVIRQHLHGVAGHGCEESHLLGQSMLQSIASSPDGGELLVRRLFLHQLLVPFGELLLLGTLCFLLFSLAPFEEIAVVPSLFVLLLIVSH